MNEKTPAQGRARTSGQISPNVLHLQENDQCGCFPWSSNKYPGIHERRIYEIQFTEKLAGGQLCRREDNTGYMQLESYNITVYLNDHEGYFSLLNQPNLLICIYRKSIQAFWGFPPHHLLVVKLCFFFLFVGVLKSDVLSKSLQKSSFLTDKINLMFYSK